MRMSMTTADGKYTVMQEDEGGMRFLRYGEPWPAADRDFVYVGLILVMAQEIVHLRERVQELEYRVDDYARGGDYLRC